MHSLHGPSSGPENPGGQAQSERPIPPTDRSRTTNDPALLACLTRQRGTVGDISLFRTSNFDVACRQRTLRRQVKKQKRVLQSDDRRHCDHSGHDAAGRCTLWVPANWARSPGYTSWPPSKDEHGIRDGSYGPRAERCARDFTYQWARSGGFLQKQLF